MTTRYPRSHQKAYGVEPPDRVLWSALRERLSEAEFAAVQEAYRKASQRYQRACKLNQMARWAYQIERREALGDLDKLSRAKLAELRAILAEPAKYINGEGEDASD